ncbi:MAG TPA: outer membrane beta-barrel protein [Verrucomicrobiae bacterium]|nr:outer membrane beta-barrel protein [Verrucomicrobiae bacterium]
MKFNKWTMGLAAVGVVSLASAARADETPMSQVQTSLSNTTLSGYVDTSAMWNTGTQNGATTGGEYGQLPPYTPGLTHGDGFNLNAVDIALDKPMDESPWAAGYHVELMFGQDAVGSPLASTSGGDGDESTTVSQATIRQAYLSLRTPIGNSGIDWKVGFWDTIIGYESSSRPLDPNFTSSYGWFIEPTSHTGILGTYKVNDLMSVSGGIANSTQGNASNGNIPGTYGNPYESQKAYMGSVTLTAPDSWGWMKGGTLTSGVIVADNGSASTTGNGTTWVYVGATIPTPMDALKFGVAFDYKDLHDGGVSGNPSNDSIWVIGGYGSYQATDKLLLSVRGENYCATAAGSSAGVPAEGHNVQEFTATAQYKLWQNVVSRLEFRWDHVAAGKAWDNTTSYNGEFYSVTAAHKNEFLLAADFAYQF